MTLFVIAGSGEFGEVFLAKAKHIGQNGESNGKNEKLVMVKSLQTKQETCLLEFKREVEMYHKLDHENVSKLVKLCRDVEPHYMIMEYSDWVSKQTFKMTNLGIVF